MGCHGGRSSAYPLVMGADVVTVAVMDRCYNAVGRLWVWKPSVVRVVRFCGGVLRRGSGVLT